MWNILLRNERSTCNVDLPLKVDEKPNVLLIFKNIDNSENCEREASRVVEKNQDAKFFFWSSNLNPMGNISNGNCLVFRSCNQDARIYINHPGDTYQVYSGNHSSELYG